MTKNKDSSASIAKTGEALEAQRFQMLKDIAEEMTGEIVFPINFDLILQIRKSLLAPGRDIDQLAALLGLEPLISARLIGLANSIPHVNGNKPVHGLKDAINLLGIEEVRAIALSMNGNQLLLSKDMVEFDEFAKQLWAHSLHAASAAYVISKRLTRINPDEAMLAGLIHDLGAFYMLYRATQYDELRIRPDTIKHLISQWHESIGHALLLSLGIPEAIADAIRDHDQPRHSPHPPRNMADVVYVSNMLASEKHGWRCQDNGVEQPRPPIQIEAYRALADEIDEHEKQQLSSYSFRGIWSTARTPE
jgi:HD-like signal output (HDOD) protein